MNTYIPGLELYTIGDVVSTSSRQGPRILVMAQYAYTGSGKTVHSYAQIKHNGNSIRENFIRTKTGGGHDIISSDIIIDITRSE